MHPTWLEEFLIKIGRNQPEYCVRWGCTTCGNGKFISELSAGLGLKSPRYWQWTEPDANTLAEALAALPLRAQWPLDTSNDSDLPQLLSVHEAIRNLLSRVGPTVGEDKLGAILKGSWPAQILRGMQRHRAEREAEYEEQKARERLQQEQRAERKRQAQIRHAARLELKKERDRVWWETHTRPRKP